MKEQRNSLAPRLRFPQFRQGPAWSVNALGRLFSERQETGLADLPLLSLTDRDGIIPQEDTNRKNTSNSDKTKYLRVVPGDIAYNTMRMWEGRSARVGIEGLVSPAYTVCQPIPDIDSVFFAYYFKTQPLIEQFRRYSQGLVKDTLNLKYETFARILVGVPEPAEQRKIAACLASLDELLVGEHRKLEGLRAHRKALMQQVFPREGESRPCVRFPEFRHAADWREEKLDDLAKRGTGHTPNKTVAEYYNGGINWISLADSHRLDQGLISETAVEISEEGILNSSAVLHSAGTVVISRDAGVGKCGVMGLPMAVSQHFITWTCNDELLSNWFLYYLLQLKKPAFERVATGSTIKTIGMPFFVAMCVTVPEPAEQRRIADCLFSLDVLIAAQSRKVAGLRAHKKALMQQLFPSKAAQ